MQLTSLKSQPYFRVSFIIAWVLAIPLLAIQGCGTPKKTLDCSVGSVGAGYCLVWQDEFNDSKLDLSKWSYEKNCTGGGNHEAQCYVDNAKNVWVDGQYLHIKAIREDLKGPGMTDDESNYSSNDKSGSGTYSSGRIRTKGKGDWRYGRFEIRAKLPYGQGSWPAIWMLPTDWVYGGWPASGEIDIMEAVNLKVGGESEVHGTLHYGDSAPNNVYSGEAYRLPNGANPADDFHIYALEWDRGEIRWYVDGRHYSTQTESGWYSLAALSNPSAPFDQYFHLILNLAVGGDWAGTANDTGIDDSVFPQEMLVDYVRVYECSTDPTSGKGCATVGDSFVKNAGVKPPTYVEIPSDGNDIIIFNGQVNEPYFWNTWTAEGEINFSIINVGGNYTEVAEITYNSNEGIGYFQSAATANISSYKNIEFDLRVTSDNRINKTALEFRADCVYPCTSGIYSIGYPNFNQWTHYVIPLAVLVKAGLDSASVNTPFVIAPAIGNGKEISLQIDNIIITR